MDRAERVRELVRLGIEAFERGGILAVDGLLAEWPELADEVRERLDKLDRSGLLQPPPSDEHPDWIGPFRVIEELGHGGMGTVYRAEQGPPLSRDVAVKVVRLGMDTERVLQRFDLERQVLGQMRHEGIARVFDAGAMDDGRPYFAMEYVRGGAITEYCDARTLDTEARIELFSSVCEAVDHAHERGIVHRDIKPSNVLVDEQDGRPLPKVIDFGVAKALDRHATERTIFTEVGQVLGTPEYMSPEQAGSAPDEVDGRTDVYSLGVMLYELMTGMLPIDRATLESSGAGEMHRLVRELDPPTPSRRVSSRDETATAAARFRATDPATLAQRLQGDLDWITMRALEKEPARRYASARELADDLRRHLRHEPVLAGPPSLAYRTRKYLRRHAVRVGLAATAVASLALGAFLARVGGADRDEPLSEGGPDLAGLGPRRPPSVVGDNQGQLDPDIYMTEIAAVQAAIADNRVDVAQRFLDSVAARGYTGWEHGHLRNRLDESVETWRDTGDGDAAFVCAAIDGGGDRVAVGRADGRIEVWARASRTPVREVDASGAAVAAIAWLDDLDAIVAGDDAGALHFWTSDSAVRTVPAHDAAVTDVTPLGAGAFATCSRDGSVREWSSSAAPLAAWSVDGAHAWSVDASPDGAVVMAAFSDGRIRAWHRSSGAEAWQVEVRPGDEGRRWTARFDPSGEWIAYATPDGSIRVVDAIRFERRVDLYGCELPPGGLRFLAGGDELVAWGADRVARLWDVETGRAIHVLRGHGEDVTAVCPRSSRSLVSASLDGTLKLWDLDRSDELDERPMGVRADAAVAVGPDAKTMATIGADGAVLWDLHDAIAVQRLATVPGSCVAYDPRGRHVAAGFEDGAVRVWRLGDGSVAGEGTGHAGPVLGIAFAPDGSFLMTAGHDGAVRSWGVDGSAGRTWTTGAGPARAVAVHPDGSAVAAATDDGRLLTWSTETGERVAEVRLGARATDLLFRQDGEVCFVGLESGAIVARDATGWELVEVLTAHTAPVTDLELYEGRLLSTGEDSTLRLWDTHAFVLAASFEQPGDRLEGVGNGSANLVTCGDGKLTFYDLSPSTRPSARSWERATSSVESRVAASLDRGDEPAALLEALWNDASLDPVQKRAARHLVGLASDRRLHGLWTPEVVDPQWSYERTLDCHPHVPRAVEWNPHDGRLYIGTEKVGAGVYRIAALDAEWELVVPDLAVKALTVDPVSGDLFLSLDGPGLLYRVPAIHAAEPPATWEVWIDGFGSPLHDADPIGSAIAPPDYSGPLLAPGQALAADYGYGSPPAIYRWSTAARGSLGSVLEGVEGHDSFMDVAIDRGRIFAANWSVSSVLTVRGDGAFVEMELDAPLPHVCSVAIDPVEGALYSALPHRIVRIETGGAVRDVALGFGGIGGGGSLAFSADGERMYVADTHAQCIRVFRRE